MRGANKPGVSGRLVTGPPNDAPADGIRAEPAPADREEPDGKAPDGKAPDRKELAGEEPDRHQHDREERRLLLVFREHGDPGAFDELVRRTESRVRGIALAILRDPAETEDAAQEAYLRAFRRADDYRGEGPVGAWLCRIAVRCAHDALRRSARRRRLAEAARPPDDAGDEPAARTAPDEPLRRAELQSALRSLPEDEREALLLKEVAGMTYAEIAAACEVPVGTAQSRIHRARRRLLAALEPEGREKQA